MFLPQKNSDIALLQYKKYQDKKLLPAQPAIYIITIRQTPLYIGRSSNSLKDRIKGHEKLKEIVKIYNKNRIRIYYIIEEDIEKILIARFKPKFNCK